MIMTVYTVTVVGESLIFWTIRDKILQFLLPFSVI